MFQRFNLNSWIPWHFQFFGQFIAFFIQCLIHKNILFFSYLGDLLPALHETYDSLMTNRACWQSLDSILQEEGLPSGGLDYLKDLDLEKKVLERVSDKSIEWCEDEARKAHEEKEEAQQSPNSNSPSQKYVPSDKPCSSKTLR